MSNWILIVSLTDDDKLKNNIQASLGFLTILILLFTALWYQFLGRHFTSFLYSPHLSAIGNLAPKLSHVYLRRSNSKVKEFITHIHFHLNLYSCQQKADDIPIIGISCVLLMLSPT